MRKSWAGQHQTKFGARQNEGDTQNRYNSKKTKSQLFNLGINLFLSQYKWVFTVYMKIYTLPFIVFGVCKIFFIFF